MKPLLRFEGVTLSRGGRLLFEGLDLALEPGEALQVIGPNGSGKSSFIRLAAGLLRQQDGRIDRGRLALADDHPALDRELPLGRALRFWGGTVDSAMIVLGIAHLAEVPVRLLSSGQVKRATLARVASSGAMLWLLDEPLNALDLEACEQLTRLIEQHLSVGGAVIAASHQPMPGEWRRLELGK